MPTRSQLVAAIDTLRGRTPTTPIKDTELADMLQTWVDYFDNNGEIMPETFQSQLTEIISTYDAHVETFLSNIRAATTERELAEQAANFAEFNRAATEQLKNTVQILLDNALTLTNPQGEYNAATNLPAQNYTPIAGVNGTYFEITETGLAQFSGSNFTLGVTNLLTGGKLIKKNATTWFYQPPTNMALTNLNGVKVKDAGDVPGLMILESQYMHPRGEAEMAGNVSYSAASQWGHGQYEQMTGPALFNKARAYIYVGSEGDITVRAYKSSTFQQNPANMTLLSEVVIPAGSFNRIAVSSQLVEFPVISRLKAGEFLYVMYYAGIGNRLAARQWNVDVGAGVVPVRHGFLHTPEPTTPWNVVWSHSSSVSFRAATFELLCVNPGSQEKYAYDQTKLKLDKVTVNASTGKLGGVYIPKIQTEPSRGNSEIIGDGSFSGASYFGFGQYEQMPDGGSFNKIDISISVLTAGTITMRMYATRTIASPLIFSEQRLLYSQEFASGAFNTVSGAIVSIAMTQFVHVDPGEYVYVVFATGAGNVLNSRRFVANATLPPLRHSYVTLTNTGGDPTNPWNTTWGYTSVGSGYYAPTFRLYISDIDPDINQRLTNAESKATNNEAAILALNNTTLLKSADGAIRGGYIPEVQYIHPRGEPEMVGNSSFSNIGYYGQGIARLMTTAVVFNRIELPFFTKTNVGIITIRIYKGATLNAAPDAMTLLYSKDILSADFNKVNTGAKYQILQLITPLVANANDYIHVYAFSTSDNNIAQRVWTADEVSPARARFKYKQSNVAWDTPWANSSSALWATDFRLSMSFGASSAAVANVWPRLILPSKIWAIVGTEQSLFYDAMIMSSDYGLAGSLEYNVNISCSRNVAGTGAVAVGVVRSRYWRLNAVAAEVGTHVLTVIVTNKKTHEEIARKTASLIVVPASFPAVAKLYHQNGDSITADGNSRVAIGERMLTLSGGVAPTSTGMGGSGQYGKHDARGGWKYLDFVTDGMAASQTQGNPYWNETTGQLDITNYRTVKLGLTAPFDLASFQCGVNDMRVSTVMTDTQIQVIIDRAKLLITAFITDSPNMKALIQLPTTMRNTPSAFGNEVFYINMWRFREMIIEQFDNFLFHPQVYVGHAGICVDRYFAYRLQTDVAGARFTETETNFTDDVHMRPEGYKSMGDALFPQFIGLLQS